LNGDALERLAATCLFPSFDGLEPPDWVRRRVQEGLGGVVLFSRNIASADQLAELTKALRAERADVLIATDEEGGDVARLEAATGRSYPGNWALGVIDDASTTGAVAGAIAADLGAAGINLDLAPVADVNTNPLNPVIGTRSFGSDAELVARHTAAFVTGLQAGGVAACAKHFPGHGDTALDSHLALPAVEADRDALLAGPLRPFRAAIAAGVKAVMTAHIVVPAIDDQPATLSSALLDGLLRRELGFDGIVMTDALDMAAIAAGVGVSQGAVRALAAGADALCLGPGIDEPAVASVHAAIVGAVRSGALAEERLAEAAGRVRTVAAWSARATRPVLEPSPEVGLAVARRALRVEGGVALTRPPLVVELEGERSIASDPPRRTLAHLLDAEHVRIREGDRFDLRTADAQLVLVVRDVHRYAWQRRIVEAVARDAIVVETGVPHWRPAEATRYVATHGSAHVNLQAAADQLLGLGRPEVLELVGIEDRPDRDDDAVGDLER
jgi:beta-N-acetylhexosaminidase